MGVLHKILLLILLIFVGCENSTINTNPGTEEYPAVVEALPESEQVSLAENYQSNNDPGFCGSVNEYGLNDSEICNNREILRIEIKEHEERRMQEMAAQFLERNSDFTNVVDTTHLEIESSLARKGCVKCDGSEDDMKPIGWRIAYKNQTYEGLEVKNTPLVVFMDAEKVYQAFGHWYRNIVIPTVDKLDFDDARESLLGKELTYSDWTGEHTLTITEESFGEYEEKVIYPLQTEQGIELRVCLAIEAGIWHFYIDSTTGELVQKIQIVSF